VLVIRTQGAKTFDDRSESETRRPHFIHYTAGEIDLGHEKGEKERNFTQRQFFIIKQLVRIGAFCNLKSNEGKKCLNA